jgi:hypothetical protein
MRTGTTTKLSVALLAAALIGCLLAPAAGADPHLELELQRTGAPLHVGDERLAYEATVSNDAGAGAKVGDTLTCKGTPADGVNWIGDPAPTFTYSWLRNGEIIVGATERTYTPVATDEGKSVQCVVTGTNDPEDALPGTYAPIASSAVSLPPTVIDPPPPSAPPSGNTRSNLGGALTQATPSGTATTTEGSDMLTEVVVAAGSGTLSSGSTVVSGVAMDSGRFEPGHVIVGTCVPAETTIFMVKEIGAGIFELTLSKAATCSGEEDLEAGARPFGLGQEISGECIPAGAKVIGSTGQGPVSATARVIVMDKVATCSKADASITATASLSCGTPSGWTAGSAISWSFQWLRNGEEIAGATDDEYTVQGADTSPPSILQCEATAEDGEGNRAVALSEVRLTSPRPPEPYGIPPITSDIPTVDFENQTAGPVTLELEAPEGAETFIFRALGSGWKCAKAAPDPPLHATVGCTRSDVLAPQDSYPPLEVVMALGQNPPATLVTKAQVSGGGAPDIATAEDEYATPNPALPFGFEAFETEALDVLGGEFAQAGGHPFSVGASLAFNTHKTPAGDSVRSQSTRQIRTKAPPGFIGNPQALGELCPSIADVLREPVPSCPLGSVVGEIATKGLVTNDIPIYAMEPEEGQPALFAFKVEAYAYTLTPELRPEDGYAIDLVTQQLPKFPEIISSEVVLCGFGAIIGNSEVGNQPIVKGCRKPNESGSFQRPFLTLPTKCGDPASATTEIIATSWEGEEASAQHTLTTPEGCEELQFEPTLKARPTTNRADSPTGLDFNLHIPQNEDPEGLATAHLKKAAITLPEGLVVNPSGANGLDACTEAQVGMKAGVPIDEPVACPDSSKIGSVSVTTPILDHPLPGSLYVATPHQNPFDSLIALWLVVESPKDGITIKLAGKTEADPNTGRLTSTFDQNPQAPVEDVELKLRGGASAPLRTPERCSKYTPTSQLTPWSAPQSGPPATPSDSFQITRGPTGGACASSLPNTPSFEAGTASAIAGAFSPFIVNLRREDGTQQFSQVTVTPPPGLVAKLAGTSQCPDSALAQAQSKSGKVEQSSPSCPSFSELGNVIAAAGAGPAPFHATGKAYLAGPYKGAPLSIAIVTPAVAGPFDLGTVVVRAAAHIDPATAEITVTSDPLPRILEGIPLDIRSATVSIDRPDFTLNPTSCDPMAAKGSLLSTLNQTASLQSRFQLAECGRLAFKPKLALKLNGKTKRGDYQGVEAILRPRPGDANIASTTVRFPRSAFVAQEHIRTICTRVQWAKDACPKGSIYGTAIAKSPLLDYPLQGNVYLRSSDNDLPDAVADLRGPAHQPIRIEVAVRNDSVKGALRNTVLAAPDAPVSFFRLRLFGGRKGLIVNSRDLCSGTQRASVEMSAHNGKERSLRPVVGNGCSKARRGKGRGKGGAGR